MLSRTKNTLCDSPSILLDPQNEIICTDNIPQLIFSFSVINFETAKFKILVYNFMEHNEHFVTKTTTNELKKI